MSFKTTSVLKNVPDQRVLDELVPWREEIDVFAKQTVASTHVVLRSKRGEENNLGNLVTDSMVDHVSVVESKCFKMGFL